MYAVWNFHIYQSVRLSLWSRSWLAFRHPAEKSVRWTTSSVILDLYFQDWSTRPVPGRLPVWTETRLVPLISVWSAQRMQGHLHGLVSVSFVLCLVSALNAKTKLARAASYPQKCNRDALRFPSFAMIRYSTIRVVWDPFLKFTLGYRGKILIIH